MSTPTGDASGLRGWLGRRAGDLSNAVSWAADYLYVARRAGIWLHPQPTPEAYRRGTLAPVVLVPGVWEPWSMMRPVGDRLSAEGHPVYAVDSLRLNTASIPDAASILLGLLSERDLREVVLVAHSKGGLIGKLALSEDAERRIAHLVAVAAPFGGSVLARFVPLRSIRTLRPEDAVIARLAADGSLNHRITSIHPAFDPHIPGGSSLRGAVNIPVRAGGHFRVLNHPDVLDAVARAAAAGSPQAHGRE